VSAPDGRHSLSGAVPATRSHRRDVLAARLDETGRDPVWRPGLGEVNDRLAVKRRDMRLDTMWRRTGPGRRDRWAVALAQDLAARDRVGGMSLTLDGIEIELTGGSAAEIVARAPAPVLVPPPAGLLKATGVEIEHAVRAAEEVLDDVARGVAAAPSIGKRLGDFFKQTFPREHGGDE